MGRLEAAESRALTLVSPLAIATLIFGLGGTRPNWNLPVFALVLCCCAFGVLRGVIRIGRPGWTTVDVLVAAVVLIPLAQLWLRSTVDAAATEAGFLQLLAAAGIFWVARDSLLVTKRAVHLIEIGAALTAGGLGIEGILQLLMTPHQIYGFYTITTPNARPMGPFINRDDFAACIELLLPFALILCGRSKQGWRAMAWVFVAAIAVAAVLLSASRAGAGVVLAELVVFVVWKRTRSRPTAKAPSRAAWATSGLGLAAALILVIVVYAVGIHELLQRMQDSRLAFWERWNYVRSGIQMGLA
ncbi:MAG: hypothetical protein ACRD1L_13320, partial [Terriglobales bacterium]